MTFSEKEKILMKSLHLSKEYNASRLLAEFPDKGWTKRSINRLFQKLRETGTVHRRVGSGRPRSARTEENIDLVDDLIVSQEDKPQTQRVWRKKDVISSTCCSKPALFRMSLSVCRLELAEVGRAEQVGPQVC